MRTTNNITRTVEYAHVVATVYNVDLKEVYDVEFDTAFAVTQKNVRAKLDANCRLLDYKVAEEKREVKYSMSLDKFIENAEITE